MAFDIWRVSAWHEMSGYDQRVRHDFTSLDDAQEFAQDFLKAYQSNFPQVRFNKIGVTEAGVAPKRPKTRYDRILESEL